MDGGLVSVLGSTVADAEEVGLDGFELFLSVEGCCIVVKAGFTCFAGSAGLRSPVLLFVLLDSLRFGAVTELDIREPCAGARTERFESS